MRNRSKRGSFLNYIEKYLNKKFSEKKILYRHRDSNPSPHRSFFYIPFTFRKLEIYRANHID